MLPTNIKRYVFFAYRDWAINIFNNIQKEFNDDFILITNKNLCTLEFINQLNPTVIFFYGWSWFVDQKIINYCPCLCLHPSKLPKYRGGSPIQHQIINGENTSAVTIFRMNDTLDAGDIYFQKEFDLIGYLPDILNKIQNLGIEGTIKFIMEFKYNNIDNINFIKQNNEEATIYKRLKPTNSEITSEDFKNYDAKYFYDKVRCLQEPYPKCYIKCKTGKIILNNIDYDNRN